MEDKSYRDAIAIDFDGVLHSYVSGWKGVSVIADHPVPGAIGWLIGIAMYSPYDIIIHSCRCREQEGIEAIENWIYDQVKTQLNHSSQYAYEEGYQEMEDDLVSVCASIVCSAEKSTKAFIFIDDRGWKFNGTFPSLTELDHFKPWYK